MQTGAGGGGAAAFRGAVPAASGGLGAAAGAAAATEGAGAAEAGNRGATSYAGTADFVTGAELAPVAGVARVAVAGSSSPAAEACGADAAGVA